MIKIIRTMSYQGFKQFKSYYKQRVLDTWEGHKQITKQKNFILIYNCRHRLSTEPYKFFMSSLLYHPAYLFS